MQAGYAMNKPGRTSGAARSAVRCPTTRETDLAAPARPGKHLLRREKLALKCALTARIFSRLTRHRKLSVRKDHRFGACVAMIFSVMRLSGVVEIALCKLDQALMKENLLGVLAVLSGVCLLASIRRRPWLLGSAAPLQVGRRAEAAAHCAEARLSGRMRGWWNG